MSAETALGTVRLPMTRINPTAEEMAEDKPLQVIGAGKHQL